MKKIIVACGSGVATSQTVACKVKELCEARGIPVQVEAVDIKSIDTYIRYADVYISIAQYNKDKFKIPVISGIPFLTGIGLNEAMDKLERYIKSDK